MLKILMVSVATFAGMMVAGAVAQSLTPEQLQAMIDERLSAQNPYQAILADPDPERSRAAMEIMLESRDTDLIRMALEFGLLSPNPQVRRIAVEAYMATSPVLTLRLDGTNVTNTRFVSFVRESLGGTLDSDRIGYARIDVGALNDDGTCFVDRGSTTCLLTINSDGIFLTGRFRYNNIFVTARMLVNDSGQLEGVASLRGLDEPVPVTIQLLD